MSLIIFLFAVGIVLLALEVVLPGAILGVVGACAMLGGIVSAFISYGVGGGMIALVIGLVVGAIVLYLEFVFLPRSRLAKALSVGEPVAGTSQPPIANRAIVGKEVVAVTALAPSGYVELEGTRYEAFSRSGMVSRGERLQVVDLDNFRLIVSKS